MKTKILILFFFLFLFLFLLPKSAEAGTCPVTLSPQEVLWDSKTDITITGTGDADPPCFLANIWYKVAWNLEGASGESTFSSTVKAEDNNVLTFKFNKESKPYEHLSSYKGLGTWYIVVCGGNLDRQCDESTPTIVYTTITVVDTVTDLPPPDDASPDDGPLPILDGTGQTCVVQAGLPLILKVTNLLEKTAYQWFYPKAGNFNAPLEKGSYTTAEGETFFSFPLRSDDTKNAGEQMVCVYFDDPPSGKPYQVGPQYQNCLIVTFRPDYVDNETDTSCDGKSKVKDDEIPPPPVAPPCPNEENFSGNRNPSPSPGEVYCPKFHTALFGDIATDPASFIGAIMGAILSLAGGIAVLIIIWAGYKMAMSRGNPEKIEEAKEQLTSAIIGLLFIIFSLVILEIIGVDILRLPCFNEEGCKTTQALPGKPAEGTVPGVPVFIINPEPGDTQIYLGKIANVDIWSLPRAEVTYTLTLSDLNDKITIITHANGTCEYLVSGPDTPLAKGSKICGSPGGTEDPILFNLDLNTNDLQFDTTQPEYTYILTVSGGAFDPPVTKDLKVINNCGEAGSFPCESPKFAPDGCSGILVPGFEGKCEGPIG